MTKLINIAKVGEPDLEVHPEALDQHLKLGWKVSEKPVPEDEQDGEALDGEGDVSDTGAGDVVASDAARKLAADNKIDLAAVKGTGANGSITKGDVQKAIGDTGAGDGKTEEK